jgi:hypothetical protein
VSPQPDTRGNLKGNKRIILTGRGATNLGRGLSLVYCVAVTLAAVFFVPFNSLYFCLGTTQLPHCTQFGLPYQGQFFGVYWLDPVVALSNSLILILTISTVVTRRKSLLEGKTGSIAAVVVEYVIGPIFIAWMLLGIYILELRVRQIPQAIPFETGSGIRIFVDGYASEIANSFFLGLFYGSLFVPSMPILGCF